MDTFLKVNTFEGWGNKTRGIHQFLSFNFLYKTAKKVPLTGLVTDAGQILAIRTGQFMMANISVNSRIQRCTLTEDPPEPVTEVA